MKTIERPPSPSPAQSAIDTNLTAWHGDERAHRTDTLAGCSVAVTMRTPGDDFDLATGFLFTEGIIRGLEDIASIAHCPDAGTTPRGYPVSLAESGRSPALQSNVVNINPSDHTLVDPERWRRNFFATSSCGICGKASIESVHQHASRVESGARIAARVLYRLESELRGAQTVFGQTGGLHAAGLFDLEGRLVTVREDIGRHNAVDKVVGDALRRNLLPSETAVLMVSGRASFEIVQKALMARIPIVAAVSAPSSLAVELARSSNMTLVAFLRSGRFNVYARTERITSEEHPSPPAPLPLRERGETRSS